MEQSEAESEAAGMKISPFKSEGTFLSQIAQFLAAEEITEVCVSHSLMDEGMTEGQVYGCRSCSHLILKPHNKTSPDELKQTGQSDTVMTSEDGLQSYSKHRMFITQCV